MDRRFPLLALLVVSGCASSSSGSREDAAPRSGAPAAGAPAAAPAPATASPAGPPSADELARVEAILRTPQRDTSRGPEFERAAALAPLGDRALPALAALLTSDELGLDAATTMLLLDEARAAPLVFASMPRSDRNVQFHVFGTFNRRLEAGEPICCAAEMYEAAVRCLQDRTPADAAERAIYAIGLTGGPADVPLLEAQFAAPLEVPVWRDRIHDAASAALARLGEAGHLARIEGELAAPVPRRYDANRARRTAAAIEKAAFSGKPSFVPALCRHLDDPMPKSFGDDIPPMPALAATRALGRLAARATTPAPPADEIAAWKAWCATSARSATPAPGR